VTEYVRTDSGLWGPMPAPKFATRRDLSLPTRGTRQGKFARIWLGHKFMPAQQYIADVAGELLPNGLPRYTMIVVTEQRQAGKSHLAMARKGERCFARPNYRSWYCAQTGGDSRDQFLKFGEIVDQAPLGRVVRTLIGNGREVMKFPNGSWIRPHPPTEQALHGKQSDDNDIDEAWAFTEDEGKQLLQAVGPTQLTRPGAQTWIWSAGGTASSTWLAALVARGRAGDPSIAYFEWGIPDDADPEDLDVIAEHHPAYGHTISMESLRSLRSLFEDDPAGWARAAGNRWTEVIGGPVSAGDWEASRWLDPIPDKVPVAYGAARSADGAQVVIAAAARVDGLVIVEIVEVAPAFGAAALVTAIATDGPVAIDPNGPSAGLALTLAEAGQVELIQPTQREYSAACANLVDAIGPRAYRYRRHPVLDAAVQGAGKRKLGDGGFVWSRVSAAAPIAALEAATLATHALTGHATGKPVVHFKSA
jgi:hypothetical protein